MYTKITNARHGASAIDYVLQERGHYKEKRNEYVTGVNLMLSGDVSITEQMEQYWNKMSEQNKKVYKGKKEDLEKAGYSACKSCNP